MERAARYLCLVLTPLLLFACDETASQRDGGQNGWDGGTTTCPYGVDRSQGWESAIELAAEEDSTGYICPAKDRDFFKVEVPAGHKLLNIKLQHSVSVTQLQLTYLVIRMNGDDQEVVGRAPLWTGSGIRAYDEFHCVDPGTYYIVVFDDGDDGKDGTNAYTLSYSSQPDSDQGEPQNNLPANAGAPGTGTIACNGDVDYFKVTVGSDQLLEVSLTSSERSTVDLKYTIYDDQQQLVATDANPDGSKSPTDLRTIHALPHPGTYYIAVQDDGDDDSDPTMTYTLSTTTRAETDPGDQGTRNDHPRNATELSWSACSDSGGCTRQGQIGSKADVDYFKITGMPSGISANNMAVMEVSVDFGGPSAVDPQVAYIYPHAGTSCSKDSCCRVINEPCASWLDCMRDSYVCIMKEGIYCGDRDCVSDPSTACPTQQACAGAVVCLPEGSCGAEQVVRQDNNGDDGAQVRTAHPLLHPGPWYIRVGDMSNDEYDYGNNYTLTVKVRMDPDNTMELNSEYFPVQISSAIGSTDFHVSAAKDKGIQISPGQTIRGHISYEGDQDWYIFDHPCPGEDCTYSISYRTGPNCPSGPAGSGLEFVYILRRGGGNPWFSFPRTPAAGQSGTFGDDECLYAYQNHSGSYIFSVSDKDHNSWSWDCYYEVTFSAISLGCNPPCVIGEYEGDPRGCTTP